jgi:hypothetical protein
MKLTLLLLLFFLIINCVAQQIGPQVGVNLSNKVTNGEHVAGYSAGISIDSEQNKRFGMSGGFYYSFFRSNKSYLQFTPLSFHRRSNTVQLPISFKGNLVNPENKTEYDLWLYTGLITGVKLSRLAVYEHLSNSTINKQTLELDNRFLFGIRSGFEFSNLLENSAFAFGVNMDYFLQRVFEETPFSSFGLYIKFSFTAYKTQTI